MVITIKLDLKNACLWIAYLVVAIGALFMAFPSLLDWLPRDSGGTASCVQAVGSLLAIGAIGWQSQRERQFTIQEKRDHSRGLVVRSLAALREISSLCKNQNFAVLLVAMNKARIEVPKEVIDALDASALHLNRIPYWDLPDSSLASELQSVEAAIHAFRISFNSRPSDSLQSFSEFEQRVKHACEAFEGYLFALTDSSS